MTPDAFLDALGAASLPFADRLDSRELHCVPIARGSLGGDEK